MPLKLYGGGLWWHAHEMIFGFACAIIVGFLLTAVQTWTGIPGTRGKMLSAVFALWLSARLAMFLPLPALLVMLLDTSFLLVAAVLFARPLIKTRMFRNLVFVIALLVLMLLNLASHLALSGHGKPLVYFHAATLAIVLIITVMGGRVIPLFTANALQIPQKPTLAFVELCAIVPILLLAAFALLGFSSLPEWLIALTAGIAAIAHSYRLYRWFDRGILNQPILWSLHLAYAFIPLALLLMAMQTLDASISTSLVMHSFTIGGIGGLILAMIARVALGHTGRKLVLPRLLPSAFMLLFTGGLLRVLLPWVSMDLYSIAITAAALCWSLAFSIYLFSYTPFLLSPRADNKPG